jgi:hypothetical protein
MFKLQIPLPLQFSRLILLDEDVMTDGVADDSTVLTVVAVDMDSELCDCSMQG